MNFLEKWQLIAYVITAVVVLAVFYYAWHQKAVRTEAERRIEAARVRSGHVPLEIPTTRGGLRSGWRQQRTRHAAGWFIQREGEHAMVDETPRMQIRYLDVDGKKVQNVLQVEQLDLQKKLIVARSDTPGDVRKIFLHQVLAARSAETGQRFNLETWVEAVRVARRRRGLAH